METYIVEHDLHCLNCLETKFHYRGGLFFYAFGVHNMDNVHCRMSSFDLIYGLDACKKSVELDFFILSVSIFWFNGNENHFLRTINMLVLCDTWISTQNSSKFYESCDHPMGGVLEEVYSL